MFLNNVSCNVCIKSLDKKLMQFGFPKNDRLKRLLWYTIKFKYTLPMYI